MKLFLTGNNINCRCQGKTECELPVEFSKVDVSACSAAGGSRETNMMIVQYECVGSEYPYTALLPYSI